MRFKCVCEYSSPCAQNKWLDLTEWTNLLMLTLESDREGGVSSKIDAKVLRLVRRRS